KLGIFPPLLQSPINAGAFTMLVGLGLVPLVSVITRKPDHKHVENCFVCYEAAIAVRARESLGIGIASDDAAGAPRGPQGSRGQRQKRRL
ncbi:MAG: hypothetical protein LBU58_11385, partial [Clostridiales bacterium]|nr:hypothetical protein [Clostridiales bacterium]